MKKSKIINYHELSRPVLKLSWDDVEITAKEMGLKLSNEEIKDIYENLDFSNEVIMDGFWEIIKQALESTKEIKS